MKTYKKIFLFILIASVLAFAIYYVNDIHNKKKEKYEQLTKDVKEYFENKYNETLYIKKNNWIYYDGVYSNTAYIESNNKFFFRVSYIISDSAFSDDYLERYLENDFIDNVRKITDKYAWDMEFYVNLSVWPGYLNLIERLYNYYELNGKPLRWDDEECDKKLQDFAIYIYEKSELIEYNNIKSIISDIKTLNFQSDYIRVIVYDDKDKKKSEYDFSEDR